MDVLVIGNRGSDSAIVWKLRESKLVDEIYVIGGNAGTAKIAHNIPFNLPGPSSSLQEWSDCLDLIKRSCQEIKPGLVIPRSENLLAHGVVDLVSGLGFPCFGPTQKAAQIETSKSWAIGVMERAGIRHPRTFIARNYKSGYQAVMLTPWLKPSVVIKADGPAAGKGVQISPHFAETHAVLLREFSQSAQPILLQEKLKINREVSIQVFTDGTEFFWVPSFDYKEVDGQLSGGVGAYSLEIDLGINEEVDQLVGAVLQELKQMGYPFTGLLYPGLALTDAGTYVLEFNARFGDPETQSWLPRLKTDIAEVMLACCGGEGKISQLKVEWDKRPCVAVVLYSGGYPGPFEKGYEIFGLDDLSKDVLVFHGETREEDGKIYTDGGRVLTLSAFGETLEEARSKVYSAISRVSFRDMRYRPDIALFN